MSHQASEKDIACGGGTPKKFVTNHFKISTFLKKEGTQQQELL
jgi:hypothetical protein